MSSSRLYKNIFYKTYQEREREHIGLEKWLNQPQSASKRCILSGRGGIAQVPLHYTMS
jgi:hypothetical protein